MRRRGGTCAVTSVALAEVLLALHVKPCCEASGTERLDPGNGLLLSAHLDALFEAGLVTSGGGGEMHVSRRVVPRDRDALSIPRLTRGRLTPEERAFMAHHRAAKLCS